MTYVLKNVSFVKAYYKTNNTVFLAIIMIFKFESIIKLFINL